MIECVCITQEGQLASDRQAALGSGLNKLTREFFQDDASINWMAVPKGCGFTAGKPSTASLIAVTAPAAMEQKTRERMLTAICEMWARETGCTLNEIVATVGDPQA